MFKWFKNLFRSDPEVEHIQSSLPIKPFCPTASKPHKIPEPARVFTPAPLPEPINWSVSSAPSPDPSGWRPIPFDSGNMVGSAKFESVPTTGLKWICSGKLTYDYPLTGLMHSSYFYEYDYITGEWKLIRIKPRD